MLITHHAERMSALAALSDLAGDSELYNAFVLVEDDGSATLVANIEATDHRFLRPILDRMRLTEADTYVRVAESATPYWNDADDDGYVIEHHTHNAVAFPFIYRNIVDRTPIEMLENETYGAVYAHLAASLTDSAWYLLEDEAPYLAPSVKTVNDALQTMSGVGVTCRRFRPSGEDDAPNPNGHTGDGTIVQAYVDLTSQTRYTLDLPEGE